MGHREPSGEACRAGILAGAQWASGVQVWSWAGRGTGVLGTDADCRCGRR